MTGFGRAESANGLLKFVVEVKTVNHRYLDANVRIPKEYAFLETNVRAELKRYIERGKTDVFITYDVLGEAEYELQVNERLARDYTQAAGKLSSEFGLKNDLSVTSLITRPEIFRMQEKSLDEDEVWDILRQALDEALEMLVETRTREGENLKADLIGKLDHMRAGVDAIEARYPQILEEYRKRLREKVGEILQDDQIDESRLAAEVVIYADKLATDEETVRLKSHIDSMKKELEKGGDVGRKLDFIAQEMNREANTILSKANDLETSNHAIDLKTEIEKIREQVQNIE